MQILELCFNFVVQIVHNTQVQNKLTYMLIIVFLVFNNFSFEKLKLVIISVANKKKKSGNTSSDGLQ